MRHFGLVPVTLLTLGLTLSVLPAAGWLSGRAPARSRFCEPRVHARAHDIPADAAARCRRARPTHWRYFVLHR